MDAKRANRIRDRVQARCIADPAFGKVVAAAWQMTTDLMIKAGANYGQVDAARLAFLIEIDGGKLPSQAFTIATKPYRKETHR